MNSPIHTFIGIFFPYQSTKMVQSFWSPITEPALYASVPQTRIVFPPKYPDLSGYLLVQFCVMCVLSSVELSFIRYVDI